MTDTGRDVTDAFVIGARGALETCRAYGIRRAFLKERSPFCGTCSTHIDDTLAPSPGVTTELLRRNGIEVVPVEGRRT